MNDTALTMTQFSLPFLKNCAYNISRICLHSGAFSELYLGSINMLLMMICRVGALLNACKSFGVLGHTEQLVHVLQSHALDTP